MKIHSCACCWAREETQSEAGMPGNFSRVRLYADRRWKVYSNNKTERMQALPPPSGHQLQVSLGSRRGGTRTSLLAGPASLTFLVPGACMPPICAAWETLRSADITGPSLWSTSQGVGDGGSVPSSEREWGSAVSPGGDTRSPGTDCYWVALGKSLALPGSAFSLVR